jgi:N-acyl-D-aspartate/D-glutamate deacylase
MAGPDLILRNGLVMDGTGCEPVVADVAMQDGNIVDVGTIPSRGKEEFDIKGFIVTPGFVDIHTHYDGHATWSNSLNPSSVHGVTTALMGNCGVGFAPCKPTDRDRLIQLMEGIEDIPHIVMAAGLPWTWESFPEYLDVLSNRRYDMDVAAQVPHAALRVFAMGERASARERATPDEVSRMGAVVEDAVRAGALGFSTSRSLNHKAVDGTLTPSYAAARDELTSIARSVKAAGGGVLQFISDFEDEEEEFSLVRDMVRESAQPLSLTLLQYPHLPNQWASILDKIDRANSEGLPIRAQMSARPQGYLAGLELSLNPFLYSPSYKKIAHLSLEKRLAAMRDPQLRAKILEEFPPEPFDFPSRRVRDLDNAFLLSDPPNYEPGPEESFGMLARKRGISAKEYAYDVLVAGDGKNILYLPSVNYVGYQTTAIELMLRSENTLLALGDAGAHCNLICDASLPTYALSRWGRDSAGKFSPQEIVKKLSHDTAAAVGLHDRGLIKRGYRADLNVIDLDRLHLHRPEVLYDLPNEGPRLHQRASGYEMTIVRGEVTYYRGKRTGRSPGRLVRGRQPSPRLS